MKRTLLAGLVLALSCGAARAQDSEALTESEVDLTLPPTVGSAPGETRLELPEEEREEVLEAVVTGGQTDWRLPDLGSSLREEREAEEARNQRIVVGAVRLYDPEENDAEADFLAPDIEVMRGLGMIRLFEVRIGRREPE